MDGSWRFGVPNTKYSASQGSGTSRANRATVSEMGAGGEVTGMELLTRGKLS